ncbi:endonuclease [Bacteriovoracaceae bacterium]|nr:endonuclease [Bacteriovoracaceae bacterium]
MFFKSKTYTAIILTCLISVSAYSSVEWSEAKQKIYEEITSTHTPLTSYTTARKYLFGAIHLKQDERGHYVEDVYCAKTIRNNVGEMRIPDHNVINCEHTWPQSRFSSAAPKSIQKSDLHHLYPTDSRANSSRGNSKFGELANPESLSNCGISSKGDIAGNGARGFEPPKEHKGNVARALFYFSIRYKIEIVDYEEMYLRQWNYEDPVDDAEMKRNNIVESVQGNRNPFIDDPSLMEMISDF